MKATWRLVLLCLAMAGLLACGISAADTPQTGVSRVVTAPRDAGSESAPGQVVSNAGLASEREEIITFTREALEIEAARNAFMEYFTNSRAIIGGLAARYLMHRYFLSGISEQRTQIKPLEGTTITPTPFEGMLSLHDRLLLLDAPQALEAVKDGLVQAYVGEIGLGYEPKEANVLESQINKDNIHEFEIKPFEPSSIKYSRWGRIQLLRLQVYERWAEILQEQGIDAVAEGFAELVVTP